MLYDKVFCYFHWKYLFYWSNRDFETIYNWYNLKDKQFKKLKNKQRFGDIIIELFMTNTYMYFIARDIELWISIIQLWISMIKYAK